jgi:hypothetical protein
MLLLLILVLVPSPPAPTLLELKLAEAFFDLSAVAEASPGDPYRLDGVDGLPPFDEVVSLLKSSL